jgi:predicted nucleic acid-binding protein
MIVILDTTEFFDTYLADSAAFRLLEDFARRTRARVAVPEVVIREVANHARRTALEVAKNIENARRLQDRIRWPGQAEIPDHAVDENAASQFIDRQLRAELRARFHAEILPLPDTGLDELIGRSMRQEKPFIKGKDGLRDALIWDSIIELMRREGEDCVFITGNSRACFINGFGLKLETSA